MFHELYDTKIVESTNEKLTSLRLAEQFRSDFAVSEFKNLNIGGFGNGSVRCALLADVCAICSANVVNSQVL